MNGSVVTRPHSAVDAARGLGVLVVLAAAIGAGAPIAVWAVDGTPVPESWPGAYDVWDAVSGPDGGSLFLRAVMVVGWLGWATFAAMIGALVGVLAGRRAVRRRHRPAPPAVAYAPQPAAPRLLMLGPVEVLHAGELVEPNKLGQLTELAMFVALHPGCDGAAMDDAIWPGSVVTRSTRSTAISKLRRWLGTDARGLPLLARADGRYALPPEVRSDWQDWCDLLPDGPAAASTVDLRTALSLVRGRPFSGRGRRKYAWADHRAQEMIVAIVDACHELAERAAARGGPREALRAALLGLSIEPGAEPLWRDRLRAEAALGNRDTVLASIVRLRAMADDLGGDLEDETEELITRILGAVA